MGATPIPVVHMPRRLSVSQVEAARLSYVRELYAAGGCTLADVEVLVVQCLQGQQPCLPGRLPMFADPELRVGPPPPAKPAWPTYTEEEGWLRIWR